MDSDMFRIYKLIISQIGNTEEKTLFIVHITCTTGMICLEHFWNFLQLLAKFKKSDVLHDQRISKFVI